ncbi:hypothetical protein A3C87_00830 [Candidatus Kaiserbacteria bacterium RIFCSPHIGHO2_02_FULL_49_34]|uniref:Uncharacterized protein n=1 Tax=Candidatus Kaiserbacteria bacterium RIFCSPHIGHO2_02_FULL_49_34 TaxID=1798491 RepID=A0A1F6DKG5_9BACT|nr:MAG: hypothetical protein A3C87_00830 [Candidatus Kaiserbacteria bacterium RIFCSPHIGHO2_02_FULL_49_34]
MEQIPFHFDDENGKELTFDELVATYKERVGVPFRNDLTRAELAAALKDPAAELARLRTMDSEDDKDDLNATYRR